MYDHLNIHTHNDIVNKQLLYRIQYECLIDMLMHIKRLYARARVCVRALLAYAIYLKYDKSRLLLKDG